MLADLLRDGTARDPDQEVVIEPSGATTYRQCLGTSEQIAAELDRRSIDRFGCVVDDVATLVSTLCASTMTGSEACVYPPVNDGLASSQVSALLDHRVVVTDRPDHFEGVQTLRLGALPRNRAAVATPAAFPVLVLTSGTSGVPRAARHDWRKVVGSVRRPDDRAGTRWLLAYNLNQFAGLQVLVHVLVSSGTLVVPATRRPVDVLATIADHAVTHVSGTPTFWRQLVGQIRPDEGGELPLRQITLGGEAVQQRLLDDLRARFPSARVSQVYAATEFGSAISVTDGRAGLPVSVLERGDDADVQVRIVDGELHVRTRIGMLGYHSEPRVGDGWRATGDLVEVDGDRIHFVGRTTEIINVGGVKVHPLPVEERAAAAPGVLLARAFGRPNPITGQIVALDIVATPDADHAELERAVRAACSDLPRSSQPRLVRIVDELPVRGGKLARDEAADGL